MKTSRKLALSTVVLFLFSGLTVAHQHDAILSDHAKNELQKWLSDPVVISQVKAQNQKTSNMSEDEIIVLDKQWRAEADSGEQLLISEVLSTALSSYLKTVKENSNGLYTEIFVMDAKGMNVGQSDVTSDYWQGDEDKWQKTFLMGGNAIHVGEVELDESSGEFQSQLSMSVVDPGTGEVIGAVTVGVNLDSL